MLKAEQLIRQSLRISKNRDFIYLNNPKAACTSVKNTLVDIENDLGYTDIMIERGRMLHDRNLAIYDYGPEAFRRGLNFCFSIVRNPFARTLSVYLDKIAPGRKQGLEFRELIGIDKKQHISFTDFVNALNDIPLCRDDLHWRAQSVNLMMNKMPLHFLGHVEDFEQDMSTVIQHIYGTHMPITSYQGHAVSAKDKLDSYMNNETIDGIIKKYKEDFENFNYSFDYKIQSPLSRTPPNPGCQSWIQEVEDVLAKMAAEQSAH